VAEPSLRYERYDLLPETEKVILRLEAGAMYASRRYNHYYYGVDAPYATATRPAFRARQGLHSYYFDTALRYQYDEDISIGAVVRMRTLSGSVNVASPLVRQRVYLSFGIGFAWSIWNSDERVQTSHERSGSSENY